MLDKCVHVQHYFTSCWFLNSACPAPPPSLVELLASFSLLPAIMCSWSVSIGPWLSFPPPLPFHFLITSPLPSLTGAQSRLSLHDSIFCSVPHFLAVLRRDPTATGNGHFPPPCSMPLAHTICFSPPPLFQVHTLGTGHRSFQAP